MGKIYYGYTCESYVIINRQFQKARERVERTRFFFFFFEDRRNFHIFILLITHPLKKRPLAQHDAFGMLLISALLGRRYAAVFCLRSSHLDTGESSTTAQRHY